MSTSITIPASALMLAPPALLLTGGLIVAVALRGFLTTGIEVARLNAANDDKTARWLWLRGYRKTPHAGPDVTDEPGRTYAVGENGPVLLELSDRSHADEQADHTDTDRAGMWRVLLGLASDLVDRVHDWLPNLLRQRAERDKVGSGEQATDVDPFAELLSTLEAVEPEPVRIVRVNRYRDPGMTGQFPYVKVAGAPRHAALEPEPEMPAVNATIPAQREAAE